MKFFLSCNLLLLVLISGCASVATQHRPPSYFDERPQTYQATNDGPLFKSDADVLSDEAILKILNYKYAFQPQNRVAILPLGQRTWWSSWSNEFAVLNEDIEKQFIDVLRASNSIFDASYLPTLLIPEKRTMPFLREAAARYQADLLFMYRINCDSYEKFRFLGANEVKKYCTVEAIVLDTRKGIIPFTVVTTQDFTAKKGEKDLNFEETVNKAEIQAIGGALAKAATAFTHFIDQSK